MAVTYICEGCGAAIPLFGRAYANLCQACAAKAQMRQQLRDPFPNSVPRTEKDITDKVERVEPRLIDHEGGES